MERMSGKGHHTKWVEGLTLLNEPGINSYRFILIHLFQAHSISLSVDRTARQQGFQTRFSTFEEKPKGYEGWPDQPPWTHSSARPEV